MSVILAANIEHVGQQNVAVVSTVLGLSALGYVASLYATRVAEKAADEAAQTSANRELQIQNDRLREAVSRSTNAEALGRQQLKSASKARNWADNMLWLSVIGLVGGTSCLLFGLGALSPLVFGVSTTAWLAYRRLKKASKEAAKEAHENRVNEIKLQKLQLDVEEQQVAIDAKKVQLAIEAKKADVGASLTEERPRAQVVLRGERSSDT